MKMYLIALITVLSVVSCDTIDSIDPQNQLGDVSIDKVANALQTVYPEAKKATITTLIENELFQASFEISNKYYVSVLNEKGTFLETLRNIENREELPTKIHTLLNQNYSNHQISGAFQQLKGQESTGYKLMLSNNRKYSSLVFDTEGELELLAETPTFVTSLNNNNSLSEISTYSISIPTDFEISESSADFTISFISIPYDELPKKVKNYFISVTVLGKFSSAGMELVDGVKTYLVSYEDEKTLSLFRFDADGNYLGDLGIISFGFDGVDSLAIPGNSVEMDSDDIPEKILSYLNENHLGWIFINGIKEMDVEGKITGYLISITFESGTEELLISFNANQEFIE